MKKLLSLRLFSASWVDWQCLASDSGYSHIGYWVFTLKMVTAMQSENSDSSSLQSG